MNLSPAISVAPLATPAPQTPATDQTRPGKSGQSVGHIAKQAVASARAAGIELPANAQGLAASQIAKGADPASIFAAQTTPTDDVAQDQEPVVEDNEDATSTPGVPDAGEPEAPASDGVSETVDETIVQYQESLSVLTIATDSGAQTALDLLS